MADLPFGFSPGDDPDRDKPKKDPDSGPGDPFGFGGGDFNMADLGQIFTKLGQMFSGAGGAMGGGSSGPVNYDLARQLASSSIGFVAPIPAATSSAIADAVHLADTWLDGATALPAGATKAVAWTPNDWVDGTLDTWKRLCDPMAEQIGSVWASSLPEEAKAMAGPLLAMMTQMGGMAFGSQLGQALGKLSREVLTSTDIGLPLGPKGVAALLPEAIESLSEGLEQPRSEVRDLPGRPGGGASPVVQPRAVAVHPAAQRRRGLRQGHEDRHERYRGAGAGVQSRRAGRPRRHGAAAEPGHVRAQGHPGADRGARAPGNPAGAGRGLGADRGHRRPRRPHPRHGGAVGDAAPPRATAGPAEQTFATLVGLELRPRKMREAAVLWERLTDAVGVDARDAVWQHPDLLPNSADLDEPAGFIDRIIGGDTSGLDIDSAIAEFQKTESEKSDEDPDGPVDS